MNLKDYFSFTRGEKRGTVVLLLIIAILIVANFLVDGLKSNHQTDFSEFEKSIEEFENNQIVEKVSNKQANSSHELFKFNPNTISDEEWAKLGLKDWQIRILNNYKAKGGNWKTKSDVAQIYGLKRTHYEQLKPFILLPDKIETASTIKSSNNSNGTIYFNFDPNTITQDDWKKLGFKDWQIKTIFNYKAKGGRWKTKSDLKKIYGLNQSHYAKLEPYILLPEKTNTKSLSKPNKDYSVKVNINTAGVNEFIRLKGINSIKYAKIIVNYRTHLGGFVKKEQLKEVWNLMDETYNEFKNQLVLGNVNPIQFNINTATINKLKAHPYISWNIANAIVKYRIANGGFEKIEDLKKIHLINNETYLKIRPYLNVIK